MDELCPGCWRRLPRLPRSLCARCQLVPAVAAGRRCAACRERPGALDACLAGAAFEGPVSDAVHRFKYPARGLAGLDPSPAALLRALLRRAAAAAPGPGPDAVVPVPLHPTRLRQRGFNPAGELGRALARRAGLPFDATALRRLRDTPSQTGQGRGARRRNVRGAFAPRPGWQAPARLWLVDDVVTTGSTLEEAARALRRAGARQVTGLCVARTPPP